MSQSNGNGNGNGAGSVRVEIYDQTYHLRGSDPEYIGELADYVDTKMRLISKQPLRSILCASPCWPR